MSEVVRGRQRSSEVVQGRPRSFKVVLGHPRLFLAILSCTRSSEVVLGHLRLSEVVRGRPRPSEAVRGHPRSFEYICKVSTEHPQNYIKVCLNVFTAFIASLGLKSASKWPLNGLKVASKKPQGKRLMCPLCVL